MLRRRVEQVPVSTPWEQDQLQPTVFSRGLKQCFENGAAAFPRRPLPKRLARAPTPSPDNACRSIPLVRESWGCWMIRRGQQLHFALEPGKPLRIVRKRFGQDFDGCVAPELGAMRLIDFAHPSRSP